VRFAETAVGFGFIFYSQVKASIWMAAHAGASGFAVSIGGRCRYDVTSAVATSAVAKLGVALAV
jgi:hypothetical protein